MLKAGVLSEGMHHKTWFVTGVLDPTPRRHDVAYAVAKWLECHPVMNKMRMSLEAFYKERQRMTNGSEGLWRNISSTCLYGTYPATPARLLCRNRFKYTKAQMAAEFARTCVLYKYQTRITPTWAGQRMYDSCKLLDRSLG
jgi:hypothetical protein